MKQSARPSVIAARAPQRKQMPGPARQPATLIARRTAERVHDLGRRSAGAPKGKRLTHVPTPLRVMPRADSGEPAGAIFFAPSDARRTEKAPPGGGAIVGLQVRQQTHHSNTDPLPLVSMSKARRSTGCTARIKKGPAGGRAKGLILMRR